MLLLSRAFYLSILLFLLPVFSSAQHCDLVIKGNVIDENTGMALPFASAYDINTKRGTVTDSLGYFSMKNVCRGTHHFQFRHIACKTVDLIFTLEKDTTLFISLDHKGELVDEVVVHGSKEVNTAKISNTIKADEIASAGNKNLAEIIGNIQGVSTLKTGSGISKPVIHGLYGSRITILNNSIAQSGQQWGNDHSPEIDPFIAKRISVIKGASALSYPGNSLGGVVLVEPGKISDSQKLNGSVNYIFQTNCLGHTINTRFEKRERWAAWKITGTAKMHGDAKSADYYLTNTGKKELNFAVQLEKDFSEKWHTNLYYSIFTSNTGILRGAHIGNTTDLEEALTRSEPFYTKSTASYSIVSPRQKVQHHLLKLEASYLISENQSIQLRYGGQIDSRKEFDVRRGDRSNIPALSLWQNSQFAEGIYEQSFGIGYLLKTGIQLNYVDNANNPETGILPLIPDYRSMQASSFIIMKREQDKLFYEFGARYDLKKFDVWAISRTLPRVIERENHLFNNYSFSAGGAYRFSRFLKANLDLGYVLRAPEINELYSFGLHQGVSGIEIGNRESLPEESLKLILSTDWKIGDKIIIQALGYVQHIQDYIYLQPQEEVELTIRGAFPVFRYEQTDAQIIGSDLLLSCMPLKSLRFDTKFSFLRGENISKDIPLVYMPADNLSSTVTWNFKNKGKVKNNSVSITGKYVAKQTNYVNGQDYLAPPDGYFLLGSNISTNVYLKGGKNIRISLKAENLLNKKYRDYLNRQRYFADDLGINIILRTSFNF